MKSTGPRTDCGKARVAFNTLKHGRRAVGLRERLVWAGYRDGEGIRSRLSSVFARPGDHSGDPLRPPRGPLGELDWAVSARVAPPGVDTSKAGMCFRIRDWDSETHKTHKDCDN